MSMGSFTFRCCECNRLLGVSRSRVGQSITCPKCGTEQPVPNPDLFGDSGGPSGMVLPPPVAPASTSPPAPASAPSAAPAATPAPSVSASGVTAAPATAEPVFAGLLLDAEPLSIRPTEPTRARSSRRSETVSESVETAATARASGTITAANDLILPRAVVRFWSLASLLGTIGAFVAGLLVGHFLWR